LSGLANRTAENQKAGNRQPKVITKSVAVIGQVENFMRLLLDKVSDLAIHL
jgi:hypothetical protein